MFKSCTELKEKEISKGLDSCNKSDMKRNTKIVNKIYIQYKCNAEHPQALNLHFFKRDFKITKIFLLFPKNVGKGNDNYY